MITSVDVLVLTWGIAILVTSVLGLVKGWNGWL